MKAHYSALLIAALAAGSVHAEGLYYIGSENTEPLPLKWTVGANLIYDDNVTPSAPGGKDSAVSFNPYVGVSFVSLTPQTTVDVYARLGLVYYFDKPDAIGADDLYVQARAGANITHHFSERLRLVSRNFLAYELEPDYSYGVTNTRQVGEYLYWQTDNALGYRWTERLATYTGFQLTQFDYSDVSNADRFTWTLYNQFRYQVSAQTVATLDYRYSDVDASGVARDSQSHYVLAGVEHRFSPNTIATLKAGAQFRSVDGPNGASTTNPHVEFALDSRVNDQFRVRAFARYSTEYYDTVQLVGAQLVEYDQRMTLRLGVKGEYALSPMMTVFAGVDYIPTSFEKGRNVLTGLSVADSDEDIFNAYVGLSVKLNEFLYGTATYNFTHSDSNIASRDYDRNRVSVGLRAEF